MCCNASKNGVRKKDCGLRGPNGAFLHAFLSCEAGFATSSK